MKFCPTCQQKYADESINFCLSDGTVLLPLANTFSEQKTAVISAPTTAPRSFGTMPGNPPPIVKNQGSGRAWMWVIGIISGVMLLLVGGFFLMMLGVVALIDNTSNNPSNNGNLVIVDKNSKNNKDKSETAKEKSKTFDLVKTDDFSTWYVGASPNGKSSLSGAEFTASPRGENYYWVLLTGDRKFKTAGKTTKITVRNFNGSPTNLGFGLVFHSRPDKALASDYAFLIDTVRQVYRIVRHTETQESIVEDWTDFAGIKSGSELNELEIRDENGKTNFFINGESVTTLETENIENGVAGVYVSDGVPITFTNLKLGN